MMESFSNVFLAVAAYGLLHSILASNWMKALAAKRLGLFAARYYRLFFNLAAVFSFLPVAWVLYSSSDQPLYSVPMPFKLLLMGIQTAAAVAALAALAQTGWLDFSGLLKVFQPDDEPQPAQLIVDGFYGWVRHPIYTFGLIFIWFNSMLTLNLLAFNLGITLYILVGIYFEEQKMLTEFGQDYAEYRRRTPMLIPPWF